MGTENIDGSPLSCISSAKDATAQATGCSTKVRTDRPKPTPVQTANQSASDAVRSDQSAHNTRLRRRISASRLCAPTNQRPMIALRHHRTRLVADPSNISRCLSLKQETTKCMTIDKYSDLHVPANGCIANRVGAFWVRSYRPLSMLPLCSGSQHKISRNVIPLERKMSQFLTLLSKQVIHKVAYFPNDISATFGLQEFRVTVNIR